MGGHAGGEIASRLAVDAIGEVFRQAKHRDGELLRSALHAANERIFDLAYECPELRGMGTTAVALLMSGDRPAWVAHVGDSRAYRLRRRRLVRLTEDHSWVRREVRGGRLRSFEASHHPRRSVLLSCLGAEPVVEVDVSEVPVEPGDRFLLCSDGLWNEVSDKEISRIVRRNNAVEAVRALVDLANERGGRDNITVQAAFLPSRANRVGRLARRVLALLAAGALFALAVGLC